MMLFHLMVLILYYSRLNKTNVDCMEKLVGLETQAKLGDSEVVPLRYQVQRLTAEVDSISSHSTWLEAELKTKNEQIANLRTTHASDMAEVRRDFDSAAMERDALDGEANTLKRQLQQAQSRMERLSQELRDSQQEATDTSLAMEQELIASQRVATIQKEQIERLQQRHDSMAGQMNSLQKLAIEAEQDGNREMLAKEQELNEKTKLILQEQAEDYKQQLANLGKKLDDANHRCKQAEDGLLLTNAPSYKAIVRQPLAIQDEPATERDEPLNLTDLYGRVTQTEDNLAAETLRRKKAEIRVARIEADIQAKAPELIRQRKEYEMVIERQEEYKKRLQNALEEAQSSRSESSELQMQVGRMRKRNKELEDDATELAKQVQTLLVSRSNSTLGMDGGSHVPASVVEMQTTNQRLLKEHRRLTATIADLESKLQEDNMRNKVETYEKELSTLREDRRRQQVLVEGIVQQRDLYRALLNKQDNNLLGSQSEEASTLQIVQQQSQRSRDLEDKNRKLELDLDVALAKLGTIDRNTEAASERLARYEALNAELTNSVDRLQVQVSTSKADVARSKADATYHKDKMIRMEENLQSSKEEVSRVTASKGDLQRINQGLQEAVSKGNAEAGKLEGELNQVCFEFCDGDWLSNQ
jgi:nucleoprotein TPR